FSFFFQAEDGIRVFHVTGVQTCALPIFTRVRPPQGTTAPPTGVARARRARVSRAAATRRSNHRPPSTTTLRPPGGPHDHATHRRSEERRVGKESRLMW